MSRAFQFILETRERLYESGLLHTYQLDHPVISVGNLTVGGTGKTPLVIALAEHLRDEGLRPVVLSRGYKRITTGLIIASRGNGPLVRWDEAGDEPFLIAQRTRGVAVIVGADRYSAGRLGEREDLGDVYILDDGFQHRRLARQVDLVAIDPSEWLAGEKLLPAGRWREPKAAITRADAACILENPEVPIPSLPIPAFSVQTVIDGIYRGSENVALKEIRGRAVVAFAGIARPERFFKALEDLGISLRRRVRFRDHHAYTRREVETLGGEIQITTEKDAVRLEGKGLANVLHLRISARIPEFDRLRELIGRRLRG